MSAYSQALDHYVKSREQLVLEALEPLVVNAMGKLEDLIAALPDGDLERESALQRLVAVNGPAEAILAPINDALATELSRTLAASTSEIRRRAAGRLPGSRTDFPQLDAAMLLRAVEVDGKSLADWTKRASPSRWMEQLLRRVETATRAGWERDQRARALASEAAAAIGATVRNALQVTVDSAFWQHAQTQQEITWRTAPSMVQPRAWQWVTAADEGVCSICRPLHLQIAADRTAFPPIPAHPRCRCNLEPLG